MAINVKSPEVFVPVSRGDQSGLLLHPGYVSVTNAIE